MPPIAMLSLLLAACSGSGGSSSGGSGGTIPAGVTSFEIVDPTPAAGDRFGETVVVLSDGNIVVSDSFDSSAVSNGGAVHLYDPVTQTLIASLYGDDADDNLGSGDILPLPNGNYVIVSPLDDVGGVVDAGSVRLMDGATGLQIGAAIAGDDASDRIGAGFVEWLANGNFVVASPFDSVGGIVLAGSVRIYDGVSGAPVGAGVAGNDFLDSVGFGVAIPLGNGNIVVAAPLDNVGGVAVAGSVTLLDGATGNPIGTAITGDAINDSIGFGGIVELANDNYAILSPGDDVGAVVDAGSVQLVDGGTGIAIGAPLTGETTGDQLGLGNAVALGNGNFVFTSWFDDEAAVVNAGSARLIDGATGAQIGPAYAGASTDEQVGFVTALGNDNYVIASFFADIAATDDAGRVLLMDGSTGTQIGTAIDGDNAGDQLGLGSVVALANDNYVIASINDDVGGVVDAGSVRLVDGNSGTQVGLTLAGETAGDQLGFGFLTVLDNGNFALGSLVDNEGVADAGSVRLVDGVTGSQIGAALAGDVASDQLGNLDILSLPGGNFVVLSSLDDEGGIVDAGSVRLVSGTTGLQIGATLAGVAGNDVEDFSVSAASNGDYFVVGLPGADNNGLADSGLVLLNAD